MLVAVIAANHSMCNQLFVHISSHWVTKVVAAAYLIERAGRAIMAAVVGELALEETVPPMAITEAARLWQPAPRNGQRRRPWPLPVVMRSGLADFISHLEVNQGLCPSTVYGHQRKLCQFLSLLELPDVVSYIGVLAGLFASGLAADVMALPILDPANGTTSGILTSLVHLCKHALLTCARKNYAEASRYVAMLWDELLKPHQRRAHKQRRAALARQRAYDAQRVGHLPPKNAVPASLRDAMMDLFCIHLIYGSANGIPWQLKHAANVILMGLVYTTTYAGRPGEWQRLPFEAALELLATGSSVLVMQHHKTDSVYGELGRYVPPCLLEAMRLYSQLPRAGAVHFFQPCRAGAAAVQASNLLRKFGAVYFPGSQYPSATLLRKLFASAIEQEDNKEKAAQLVADMDGHSKAVARRHYVLSNPASDARLGQSLYKLMYGDPPAWPARADCLAAAGSCAERLREGFFRHKTARAAWQLMRLAHARSSAELETVAAAPATPLRQAGAGLAPLTPPKRSRGQPALANSDVAPAAPLQRLALEDGPPTPAKRPRCRLTAEQRAYVQAKCAADTGCVTDVPSKSFFCSLLEEGVRAGALPSRVTAEGLRSFARKLSREAGCE